MASPIKHYNKIFILLYILFTAALYGWFYFDAKYNACALTDLAANTNSNCFIYKDINGFCFLAWILTLTVLVFFTTNNVINKGLKALKVPALVVLVTGVLFVVAELCFGVIFKG
ncbi:MAG TPA: hypothetical protein VK835_09955 [Bacteroidia bacterium]|nr:hypothetical protein [Bacteroidia bacterium]